MQFQIWVCHRGCLQFNTWAWNPKEVTICKLMFGETTIFYRKIWNHPVETTIYKWLALGFQGAIYCEALDIQTHMMRTGMNEPPFTWVPNSHLQTPGMTGGWLGCLRL